MVINQPKSKEKDSNRFISEAFLTHEPTTNIIQRISEANSAKRMNEHVMLFEKITPPMAEDVLTINTSNRPIDKALVKKYTKIMEADKWLFAGQMWKVSKSGILLDGQHEAFAVRDSRTTQTFHIHTYLPDECFVVLDDGKKRSAGDVLAVMGFRNYNILAAAIKAEIYYRIQGKVGANINSGRVSNQEVADWTKEQNIDLMERCLDYSRSDLHNKFPYLTNSTWAFVYYTLSKRHIRLATDFVDLLSRGEDTLHKSQNWAIQDVHKYLKHGFRSEGFDPKKNLDAKLKFIFTGWNAWRKGDSPKPKLIVDLKADKILKPL